MIKQIIKYTCLMLLMFGCQKKFDVYPKGQSISYIIPIEAAFNFKKLQVNDHIMVKWIASNENKIQVITDEAYKDYVLINFQGNTIDIRRSNSAVTPQDVAVKVYIYSTSFELLQMYKSSSLELESVLKGDQLDIELQEHCSLKGKVNVNQLKARIAYSSYVELSGDAQKVELEVDNSSSTKLDELIRG